MKTLERFVFSVFCFLILLFLFFTSLVHQAKAHIGTIPSQAPSPIQSAHRNLPPIIFDHLTMADGLSEATIFDMVQDEQGFMWFATQYGLDKYNGYHFTIYTHNPNDPWSISDNDIRAVYLDREGMLWVGTANGGLNRFDKASETFTHFQHDPDDPKSLSDVQVRAIHEDAKGMLWVGTNNGLNRLDAATGTFTRYENNPDNPKSLAGNRIYNIALDQDSTLWIATVAGLCRFNEPTDDFQCYTHNPDEPTSLSFDTVFVIYPDTTGTIWVGTAQGLNAFDKDTGKFTPYTHNPDDPHSIRSDTIHAIHEDRQNRLWIGTFAGLNLFDRTAQQFTAYQNDPNNPQSISGDNVIDLYQDRSGILWIGTVAAELNYVDTSPHKFVSSFAVRVPLAIQESGNQIWAGSISEGLYQIDRSSSSIKQYRHDPTDQNSLLNNEIYALHMDMAGMLWIGTVTGLDRFDPAVGKFNHPDLAQMAVVGLNGTMIRGLFQDSKGLLWIGTAKGLFCHDPSTGHYDCFNRASHESGLASTDHVYTFAEDKNGWLWVGTYSGLYHLDPVTGQYKYYVNDGNDLASLSTNTLTGLELNDDGSLWIATWGGGLNRFDPVKETFTHYTKNDGMPDDLVLCLQRDRHDRLWIGTSNGLAVFDTNKQTFRTYDRFDGLPENSFNQGACDQNQQGEMFFGAGNHVVAFHPDDLRDNQYLPPVVLTGFQLFNRPVLIGSGSILKQHPNYTTDLTLAYDQSVFSFEYTALNFSAPAKNQYAYKMEGFEADWNYVGDRRLATYTNLNAGTYTFRVIASNNDGMWNNEGLSIRVTITPPWWQTWWAYLLYVMSGIVAIAGYIRFRTRAQEHKLKIQGRELAYERQLRESMERVDRSKDEERARIAREMHDGLAQTLAAVRLRIRAAFLLNDLPSVKAELGDVHPILDETLKELRHIIFALRPVLLDEMGLAASITQLVDNVTKHYPVKIHINIVGDVTLLSSTLEHNAFRIIQEALHNAIRHAQANNIWLNVTIGTKQVELEIRDDGVGFDLALIEQRAKQGHFGLINMRQRAETLKGTATIDSTLGQGTTIRVMLSLEKRQN